MIKYHHAANCESKIISINQVTQENRPSMRFFCLGCGTEMTAVLGPNREHHFRHKESNCSLETYLHKLAKRVLKDKFDTQSQFPIKYYVQNECIKSWNCEFKERHYWHDCDSVVLKEIDLKEYYDTCEEEVSYKDFRADLMLSHSKFPNQPPVFLEVSVTHDCTPEKLASGIKIIEIKIQHESDVFRNITESELVLKIEFAESDWDRLLPQPKIIPVRFHNFKRKNPTSHSFFRFYLIQDENNIYHTALKPNAIACNLVDSQHEQNACFEVTISEDRIPQQKHGFLYAFGIALSINRGFDVKNCIFCTIYRKCNIPQSFHDLQSAYHCSKYQLNRYYLQRIVRLFESVPYWEWTENQIK